MTPTDRRLFAQKSLKRSSNLGAPTSNHPLDGESNPKRRKLSNARFDQMIETMNIVHTHPRSSDGQQQGSTRTKRKGRGSWQRDAYSPPVSSDLGHELSFIKIAPNSRLTESDRPSSESNTLKDDSGSSSASRTVCSPLPSWLADTFMSLSRKHPLRLLLPPSHAQASRSRPEKTSPDDQIEPYHQHELEKEESENIFAFKAPDPVSSEERPSHRVEDSNLFQSIKDKKFMDYTNAAYTDFPVTALTSQPMPFSTPGPTFLGSTVETNTAFSVASLTCSPPALYTAKSYVHANSHAVGMPFSTPGPGSLIASTKITKPVLSVPALPSCPSPDCNRPDSFLYTESRHPEPHTSFFQNSYIDPADLPEYYDDNTNTDDSEHSDPFAFELDENPLFSEMYTTPGPKYYAPSPMHFDSPAEDPLNSDSPPPSLGIDYDNIDFQWKPFDRKRVVVPEIPARAFFAPGESEPDTDLELLNRVKISEGQITNLSALMDASLTRTSSATPPVSPSPFRFAPTLENSQQDSSVVPGPPKTPAAPQKPSFAPVPGIYISPLASSRSSSPPSPSPAHTIMSKLDHRKIEPNTADSVDKASPDDTSNDAVDDKEQDSQNSYQTNDSIESWGACTDRRPERIEE